MNSIPKNNEAFSHNLSEEPHLVSSGSEDAQKFSNGALDIRDLKGIGTQMPSPVILHPSQVQLRGHESPNRLNEDGIENKSSSTTPLSTVNSDTQIAISNSKYSSISHPNRVLQCLQQSCNIRNTLLVIFSIQIILGIGVTWLLLYSSGQAVVSSSISVQHQLVSSRLYSELEQALEAAPRMLSQALYYISIIHSSATSSSIPPQPTSAMSGSLDNLMVSQAEQKLFTPYTDQDSYFKILVALKRANRAGDAFFFVGEEGQLVIIFRRSNIVVWTLASESERTGQQENFLGRNEIIYSEYDEDTLEIIRNISRIEQNIDWLWPQEFLRTSRDRASFSWSLVMPQRQSFAAVASTPIYKNFSKFCITPFHDSCSLLDDDIPEDTDRDSSFYGALGVLYLMTNLNDFLFNFNPTLTSFILDKHSGTLIASSDRKTTVETEDGLQMLQGKESPNPIISYLSLHLEKMLGNSQSVLTMNVPMGQQHYSVSVFRIDDVIGFEWLLIVSIQQRYFFDLMVSNSVWVLVFTVCVITLGSVGVVVITGLITLPLYSITKTMKRIENLDFSSRPIPHQENHHIDDMDNGRESFNDNSYLQEGFLKRRRKRRGLFHRISRYIRTSLLGIHSPFYEVRQMQSSLESMQHGLKSFQKYVPVVIVKKILNDKMEARLGMRRTDLTVFFSDIEDFTSLSESNDIDVLIKALGVFFETMTSTIESKKGIIDKFIGDNVMALWCNECGSDDSSPKISTGDMHPIPVETNKIKEIYACEAALDCIERLNSLCSSQHWIRNNLPIFRIRIGINSGEALIGNIGSSDRLNFTAIGDTVNVASRLEELNKSYGTNVLISESTHIKVKEHFLSEFVGFIILRGKLSQVCVYHLICRYGCASKEQIHMANTLEKVKELMEIGQSKEATELCRIVMEQKIARNEKHEHVKQLMSILESREATK